MAFIHRFDSAGTTGGAAGVIFHAALGLDAATVRQVQARVRQQVLRAFVPPRVRLRKRRGAFGAEAIKAWPRPPGAPPERGIFGRSTVQNEQLTEGSTRRYLE